MSPAFPISAYYFTFLGALGIFWPFFALYLSDVGLSPSEITRVLMVSPTMGLIAPPLFGLIADAQRARGWLLRGASVATFLSFSGFFFTGASRIGIFLTIGLFAFCRAPLLSLTDATAFEHVRHRGGAYARLRVWGSVGFLAAVLIGGQLLQTRGLSIVLSATTVALGLAASVSFLLPAPPPERHPEAVRAWLRLLGRSELWLFLAAVTLAQAAGAAYDGCFSLHLKRLGHGAPFAGLAWGIGVGAEVLLMIWAGPLIRWMGAERMFASSIVCAAGRWLLLAHVTSGTTILLLQPLHGISFGWFYVAGVTLMRDRGGTEAPTAAQGLFAGALAFGSILGMAAAGRILEQGGGQALYTVAAAVAGVGALCAIAHAVAFFRQGRIIAR